MALWPFLHRSLRSCNTFLEIAPGQSRYQKAIHLSERRLVGALANKLSLVFLRYRPRYRIHDEAKILTKKKEHLFTFEQVLFFLAADCIADSFFSSILPRPEKQGQDDTLKTNRTIIRATSLHLLPGVHAWSIYQVIFLGSYPHLGGGKTHLGCGFALRCSQRLSLLDRAIQLWGRPPNWHTSGRAISVLSYWR